MTANDREAARGATESDVHAPGALGDVPPVSGARLARYAEVLRHHQFNLADVQVGRARCICGEALTESGGVDLALARHQSGALDAVADAELEQARAENERQRDLAQRNFKQGAALLGELQAAESALTEAREQLSRLQAKYEDAIRDGMRAADWGFDLVAALVSEREAHAGLRARLEALAKKPVNRDDVVRLVPPLSINGRADTYVSQYALRAALAAEPAAPVAAEEGGEQEAGE